MKATEIQAISDSLTSVAIVFFFVHILFKIMKLYLFELGRFIYPDIHQPLPVPGYLIQTDDGKNILVDTGFPQNLSTIHLFQNRQQWKCVRENTSLII